MKLTAAPNELRLHSYLNELVLKQNAIVSRANEGFEGRLGILVERDQSGNNLRGGTCKLLKRERMR